METDDAVAEYCETNLGLLITIMERSTDPITRSNAVIALGDMVSSSGDLVGYILTSSQAVCFNHLIDENTDFLYRRLNDNDASVKRTCLMTLTFLILAGQVKVKGQLGEMAKCLEDSDKRIADLAKMFFTELATKDNAVYNHFVDMFSLLSAERELDENSMKRIVRFLASFIEKVINPYQYCARRILTVSRINMPSNFPTNWQPAFPAVRHNGNGMMSYMRCHYFSIRMRKSKRR